jgi:hypothetical protein
MSDVAEYFLSSAIVLCPDDNLLSCASIAFGKRYNNDILNYYYYYYYYWDGL